MGKEENNFGFPDEYTKITDADAAKEISFTSFLDGSDNSGLLKGLHSDLEDTESSLNKELESLYDDIIGSAPKEAVPKPMDMLIGTEDEEESESASHPLDDLWMSPEDYIEMPSPQKQEKAKEKADAPAAAGANGEGDASAIPEKPDTAANATAKKDEEDIYSLISSFKSGVLADDKFGSILDETEKSSGFSETSTDFSKINSFFGNDKKENEAFNEKIDDYLSGDFKPIQLTAEGDEEIKFESLDSEGGASFAKGSGAPTRFSAGRTGDSAPSKEKASTPSKQKDSAPSKQKKKKNKGSEIARKIVLTISIIVIIVSSGVLAEQYIYEPWKFKKQQTEVSDIIASSVEEGEEDAVITTEDLEGEYSDLTLPEGMLKKYAQLFAANQDLAGWISIPGFDINLPIAQGSDNDYYLHRDIYGKYTMYGVPFFDYRMTDLKDLVKNTVVYGHNMRHDDLIFGLLENYREISGFEQAPVVECNTIYGDHTWFVYAVFITNSKEEDDNGYSFPYNFINCSDAKFKTYIEEIDKRKLYSTGVDISESDRILTLSTCCYDFDDARLVVVCREKRTGESSAVDTSKASLNTNPKYPQAWYDVNNKSNPYANDSRW